MPFAGLPEHHPVWPEILAALGEDVRVLEEAGGRLAYTVSRVEAAGASATVVNSLPYIAYGGPHAPDLACQRTLLERLTEAAAALDADVLSVGTSPLLTEEEERLYREVLQPTHVLENPVQLQTLDPHPLEQLTRKRRGAIESELRRGERGGLRVIETLTESQFDEWLEIYRERYRELGAAPYPDEFHRQLHRRGVAGGVAEFHGLIDDAGRLLGGIAFLLSELSATYFSSAFVSEARQLFPTTFVLDRAFHDFRRRGIRTFNWHSSPSSGGVHAYKQRWGARVHRHFYLATLRKPDTALFRWSPAAVRQLFPFRFVLPFSAWPAATMP